jgi:FtsP/CotA-like multicopper oxidase with cupredoxin domain
VVPRSRPGYHAFECLRGPRGFLPFERRQRTEPGGQRGAARSELGVRTRDRDPGPDVAPGKYRFRMLNGSDSRFYVLQFGDPDPALAKTFWQIGSDDGLLPQPVALKRLVIAPGERADLMVDFSGLD